MGKPVFEPRPPEAVAPLEWPGDGLQRGAGWASHHQPTGRQSVSGLRSSLDQDPALENR